MRRLRIGEQVLGADGRRLGVLERLVVDEQAHRVTHMVIHGRLVGVQHVREVNGERLQADLDEAGLAGQPQARPELVAAPGAHWTAPGGYSIGDFLAIASALIGQGPYVPPVHLELDLSAVHEISPGSHVWSGAEHVGEVSQLLTDDQGNVESLVVRRRGLLGRRVLLPGRHVREVVGSSVHVDLTEDEVNALPEYEDPAG